MKKYKWILAMGISVCILGGCGEKTAYYEKAQDYLEKQEYRLALQNYKKAIMEDENLQEAYRGAGIAYMHQNDYKNAEDMFERALRQTNGIINDIELDCAYYLGECRINLGQYKKAVKNYTNILAYDKDQTQAYLCRGRAYLLLGEKKKAQSDFDKAAADGESKVLYAIYEAYEQAGMDGGSTYLEKIAKSNKDSADELYIRGKACAQLNQQTKAKELLEKSAQKGKNEAYFYLGQYYEKQGDYEQARKYYKTYQSKSKLTMGQYQTVVQCMIGQGDYEAALALNKSMRKGAGKKRMQNLLFDEIVIYEKSCDYETARQKAQEYTAQYPDDEEGVRESEFLQTR